MEETNLSNCIYLIVPKALSMDNAKLWFRTVQAYLPNGVIGSIQSIDNNNHPQVVQMIAKKYKSGKVCYQIPLTRNVLDKEIEQLVRKWNKLLEDGDFQIETNCTSIEMP